MSDKAAKEKPAPLLELAEHYYAVSADMRRSAEWTLSVAERLEQMGNNLCEQNMALKEKP